MSCFTLSQTRQPCCVLQGFCVHGVLVCLQDALKRGNSFDTQPCCVVKEVTLGPPSLAGFQPFCLGSLDSGSHASRLWAPVICLRPPNDQFFSITWMVQPRAAKRSSSATLWIEPLPMMLLLRATLEKVRIRMRSCHLSKLFLLRKKREYPHRYHSHSDPF